MLPFYIPIYLLAALLIALISYFADITAAVDPKFPFYISLVTFSGYIFTMILTTYQQFNKKNDNFKIDVSLVDKNRQLIIIYSAGQFLATIALLIATRESAFFMLVWLFSLAGALDCLRIYLQELKKYANDFYRADKLKSLAIEETSGKNFAKLIDHGQNIIEVCQASLIKNETHLFNHTANSLTNLFISFYSQFDLQQLSEKDLTTLKYSTNTTVDRCKDLCFLALKLEASTAAQNIIVNLGKIATKAAKITLSLINYPIKVILRIGFKAFDLKNIAKN